MISKHNEADFTPKVTKVSPLAPFRFWAQQTLPASYDDSLSYYQLLTRIVEQLNIVMNNVNTLGENGGLLYTSFTQLQEYVNDYYDSLDVQREINTKLNTMAADGSLTALIKPLVVAEISTHIADTVRSQLSKVVESQINDAVDVQLTRMVNNGVLATTMTPIINGMLADVLEDNFSNFISQEITKSVTSLLNTWANNGQLGMKLHSTLAQLLPQIIEDNFIDLITTSVSAKLETMQNSGEFDTVITNAINEIAPDLVDGKVTEMVNSKIGDAVATKIGDTVAEQIGDVVENQISGVLDVKIQSAVSTKIGEAVAAVIGEAVANQINEAVTEVIDTQVGELAWQIIPSEVSSWLKTNITNPDTCPIVDGSLTIAGAAADAKVTGDLMMRNIVFFELKKTTNKGNPFGDFNGDGIIDNNDIVTLSRIASGLATVEDVEQGDFNFTGKIENEDVGVLSKLTIDKPPNDCNTLALLHVIYANGTEVKKWVWTNPDPVYYENDVVYFDLKKRANNGLLYGDTNGDGTVSNEDLINISRIVEGLTSPPENIEHLDFDFDGVITDNDNSILGKLITSGDNAGATTNIALLHVKYRNGNELKKFVLTSPDSESKPNDISWDDLRAALEILRTMGML